MDNLETHNVRLRTFEQMRVIANWHYKEKLYEQATTIYLNCIASIIYTYLAEYTDSRKGVHCKITKVMARLFPPMYTEQASLIYLNICQTLLVRQNDARYKQYFGMGAAEASWRALQLLPAAFAKQQHEPGRNAAEKASQYVERLVKAYIRLGKAEMSCINFPAALRHLTLPIELAGDRGHLYNEEEIRGIVETLRKTLNEFASTLNMVPVPSQLSLALEEADPEYFHHAHVTNLVWKNAWQSIDGVDKVFSCGRFKEQIVFVARQASKGKYSYYICAFAEGDGCRPCMAALTKYSRPVTKGVYSCGAVVGDCLYLLTEPANYPDNMLCLPLCKRDGKGSTVTEVPVTGRPRDCNHSSLVTDGTSLYLFGGCTLKDGATSARNSLHKLTPKAGLAATEGLRWQELPTGGERPAERFAHGSWFQRGNLYVFGGIRPNPTGSSQPADIWTLTGDTPPTLTTLDDLWHYDLKTQRWVELEPNGSLPAARARMGVATSDSVAFVCGGATGFEDLSQKMNLADVWMFDPRSCSWVQVVPCKSQTTWMSARYSHACGMVGNSMCTVGGSISMSDQISPVEGLCIVLKNNSATFNNPFMTPGVARDKAMEKVACFMGLYRQRTGHPPHIQNLLDASKKGGCVLHLKGEDVLDIMGSCIMTPQRLAVMPWEYTERLFPGPLRYKCGRSAPFSPSGRDSPWGSENNPFHFTPRHLAGPCEVQVHLEAAPSYLTEGISAISSTMKVFGTVKAAAAYWQSTLVVEGSCDCNWKPAPEYAWEELAENMEENLHPAMEDMEEMVHPLFTRLAWSLGYSFRGPDATAKGSQVQVFLQTVTDHFYTAHLITHQPSPTAEVSLGASASAVRDTFQFLKIQQIAIAEVAHRWPCICCHCGHSQVLRSKRDKPAMKVCKGCRMVRYCSVQCQKEAWPQHKEHCRLYS